MGVKTGLTLSDANKLFPQKKFLKISATTSGVTDTTYIAQSEKSSYILKKYEHASAEQIINEKRLLTKLHRACLHVPQPIQSNQGWHLFSYISGDMPHFIELQQLQSVGRFLSRFHRCMYKSSCSFTPFPMQELEKSLYKFKKDHIFFAKKLSTLKDFPKKHDGIIHGDLFPDNVKFHKSALGVFDFIEAGNGNFSFDLGVVAMSWIAQKKFTPLRVQLLLKAYNQSALHKIYLSDILAMMEHAASIYTLRRFTNPSSGLDYKTMLKVYKKIKMFKKLSFKTIRN